MGQSAAVVWDPISLSQITPSITEPCVFLTSFLLKFSENLDEREHSCISRNIWNKTRAYQVAQAQSLTMPGEIRLIFRSQEHKVLEQFPFSDHSSLLLGGCMYLGTRQYRASAACGGAREINGRGRNRSSREGCTKEQALQRKPCRRLQKKGFKACCLYSEMTSSGCSWKTPAWVSQRTVLEYHEGQHTLSWRGPSSWSALLPLSSVVLET